MAVGETSGPGRARARSCRRRRPAAAPPTPREPPAADATPRSRRPTPLVKEADPELERLLAEEEEIERSTREHHETPHFRPGDGD